VLDLPVKHAKSATWAAQPIDSSPNAPASLSIDFICYDRVIVEIKAVSALVDEHRAQLLNYLSATNFQLGLLVNFGHYPKLEYERLANTRKSNTKSSRATGNADITL